MDATAELVQDVVGAVEAGDVARMSHHIAPDIVFRGTLGGLDEQLVLHGPDAVMRYFADVSETWDEWVFESEEVFEGEDAFVVFWRETSRSRGIEMVNETATVFSVRDGRVVEWRGYLDRAQALAAAGLAVS